MMTRRISECSLTHTKKVSKHFTTVHFRCGYTRFPVFHTAYSSGCYWSFHALLNSSSIHKINSAFDIIMTGRKMNLNNGEALCSIVFVNSLHNFIFQPSKCKRRYSQSEFHRFFSFLFQEKPYVMVKENTNLTGSKNTIFFFSLTFLCLNSGLI